MSESRRPRRVATVLAPLLALLALSSLVVASAAGLGGLRTDDLGAAAGDAGRLDGVTLRWTPVWQDGAWHLQQLRVQADAARGFRAGDEVRVRLSRTGTADCEITTTVGSAAADVGLGAARLRQVCGALPTLASVTGVAVAVTGDDDITKVGDLGPLHGSVAGFAADGVRTTGSVTATRSGGRLATVVVTGVPAAALAGADLTVVVRSGSTLVGTATYAAADVRVVDGRATVDVSAQRWQVVGTATLAVAVAGPQRLVPGVGDALGVVLAAGTQTPDTGGTGGDGGAGNGGHGTGRPGDALQPVAVSNGISYRYTTPWTGVQTNSLKFCHSFTVTNTTGARLTDWTVTFDTRLAPMWGLNPVKAGSVSLSNLETRTYAPVTGRWTVGGSSAWAQQIEAGGSRTVQLCAHDVPTPTPDPALYDVQVTVVGSNDWNVTFRVDVTSDSRYYVPWRTEVDLADLVCASSLQGRTIQFSSVTTTRVPGSSTAYVVQGTANDTQLVSATHPRSFTFAAYAPGPGWRLPCGG